MQKKMKLDGLVIKSFVTTTENREQIVGGALPTDICVTFGTDGCGSGCTYTQCGTGGLRCTLYCSDVIPFCQ